MRGRHPPSLEECANVGINRGNVYLITARPVLKNQTDQHPFVMTEECSYVRSEQGMKGTYSLAYGTMQQEVIAAMR